MLMHVRFPLDPFNASVRDGSVGGKLQKIIEAIKPAACYFTASGGQRGATLVVTLNDASEIPSLAEPFFLTFDATVSFEPFMSLEDLGSAGLDALGKEWG